MTPEGWSDFDGVKRTTTDILFIVEFDDNSTIKCTANHLLKFPNGQFLEASFCFVGDELFGGKIITQISYLEGEFEVYDLINVEKNNEYFTNGVVSHNCAFMPEADEIWTSAQMTLATGGDAIVLSTPNGHGNLFHKLWQKAEEGANQEALGRLNPIKLNWDLHPDRDQSWRDAQDELLGKRQAAQECDCDFSTSGHTVIETEHLEYYKQQIVEPIEKRGIGGDYWIWNYPDYSKSYAVVADVSRGDGEDYSGFQVYDVETMEQCAEFKGKVDTNLYGNMLVTVATEYNTALLVIDNKNIGWATVQVCLDKGYPNLYYSYKHDPYLDVSIHLRKGYDMRNKEDMVAGFSSNTIIRPVMISKLEMASRERTLSIKSSRLWNELTVFMWINGKAQAQKGYNDDLVICVCTFLFIRDTALRLRTIGIELNKQAISHVHRTVYKAKQNSHPNWEQNVGNRKENLKWLL